MSRILCPTDFSDASFEGVRMASDFAEVFSAQVVLVYVVPPVPVLSDPGVVRLFDVDLYQDELVTAMDKKLTRVARDQVAQKVQVQTRIACSADTAGTICELARTEKVDLIVIATHGMTGWRHYVHGSVAQKVVQHASQPVLLVRSQDGVK